MGTETSLPMNWDDYHDASSTDHDPAWLPMIVGCAVICWGCAAIAVYAWKFWL